MKVEFRMAKIQIISRAFRVLGTLAQKGPLELHEVQEATGLPKTTTHRILLALEAENIVHHRLMDKHWLLLPQEQPSEPKRANIDTWSIYSTQVLLDLFKQTQLPSDFVTLVDGRLKIVESTRRLSTLGIRKSVHGLTPNLQDSAVGKVFMYYTNDLHTLLAHGKSSGFDRLKNSLPTTIDNLQVTGYAIRDSGSWADGADGPRHEERALAVPVLLDHQSSTLALK